MDELLKNPVFATHAIASSGAVMLGTAVTYPLDTVKTLIQVGSHSSKALTATQVVDRIRSLSGYAGLYSGFGWSAMGRISGLGARFGVYEVLTAFYKDGREDSYVHVSEALLAGIASGALESVISSPFELLKLRAQVTSATLLHSTRSTMNTAAPSINSRLLHSFVPDNKVLEHSVGLLSTLTSKHQNMFDALKNYPWMITGSGKPPAVSDVRRPLDVVRLEGWAALWRGLRAGVVRDSIFGGTFFSTWQFLHLAMLDWKAVGMDPPPKSDEEIGPLSPLAISLEVHIYGDYWLGERFLPWSSHRNSWAGSGRPPLRKVHRYDVNLTIAIGDGKRVELSEPQDADYVSKISSLCDDLEVRVLARFPIVEIWKICLLNKSFLAQFRAGEIFKIRREMGVKEISIFMLACGERNWWAFDRQFTSRRILPELPADISFMCGDRETTCAGTHLLVSGLELGNPSIWRYDLALNQWCKGPHMISPRCLFATATCGDFAYVAGGLRMGTRDVLNTAEKYNPETGLWEQLPSMKVRRKLCAGVYMDGKFYVVGGQDENGNALTCAEVFDGDKNIWVKIPGMLKDSPVTDSGSPPLLAVVDNEIYAIEASSNQLKVYLKGINAWKTLGPVPVKTDSSRGWGVAFKSLGDELLVMGGSTFPNAANGMTVYTCRPKSDGQELPWRLMDGGKNQSSSFIWNCSIMMA